MTAFFKLTLPTLLLTLFLSCYQRNSSLEWDKFIDGDTAKTMRVIEAGEWFGYNPCELFSEKLSDIKARAVTVCNIVFVCESGMTDEDLTCVIVHEAWHVKQNGKSMEECLENMAEYGYEYGINRYVEQHSPKSAYYRLSEEKEARKRQRECEDSMK